MQAPRTSADANPLFPGHPAWRAGEGAQGRRTIRACDVSVEAPRGLVVGGESTQPGHGGAVRCLRAYNGSEPADRLHARAGGDDGNGMHGSALSSRALARSLRTYVRT